MPKITNIQKYSIHDGDGIRTTIFFKGCPLKCLWCHNPETQSYKPQIMHNKQTCISCGACVNACPNKAVSELSKCKTCGVCTDVCVTNSREISGKDYSIKELVNEALKDEMFYEQSGGGVTLSGGEVMCMDMDFIENLAKTLHKKGVSVNIDTCGFAPYENFKRILPFVDTFLYDIKSINNEIHKKYTGVDNTLILENLKKLSKDNAKINIRLPLIKEVNAKPDDIKNLIKFLTENNINVEKINLLPYHSTGSSKYERLGTNYKGQNFSSPNESEMKLLEKMFKGFSNVKIGG
ncbi:MAG: glycyl-radical enzyme activating protein [Clostridia bacterium]